MSEFVVALPMYDWPEIRAEVDAEWARLRDALRGAGIEAPQCLARRNADMPAVPGGIRDAAGASIAADPATLPADGFDVHVLWRHPQLLFAQTCWGPMGEGLAEHVEVVGQPDYSAFEGGQGELYSSAILMRRLPSSSRGRSASNRSAAKIERRGGGAEDGSPPPGPSDHPPLKGEGISAPGDGHPILPLDRLRGARFAYNGQDSMSGIIALTRDLEALGEGLDIFSDRIESGSHRASIRAVAEGRADVCAIDCRSWALARCFEPAARDLVVVGWTARRKGLPYIASRRLPVAITKVLHSVL